MNYDWSHADNRSSAVCCDSSAVTRFSFSCRYQANELIELPWMSALAIWQQLKTIDSENRVSQELCRLVRSKRAAFRLDSPTYGDG